MFRGKAVSLCMTLGRLGIIAATNLIGVMLKPYCNSTFALMTAILFSKSLIEFKKFLIKLSYKLFSDNCLVFMSFKSLIYLF